MDTSDEEESIDLSYIDEKDGSEPEGKNWTRRRIEKPGFLANVFQFA